LPPWAATLDRARLPRHVAIIMDGNGRWAKKRLFNRIKGHEKGAEAVRAVVEACRELSIPYLTLYAFSTENWGRPRGEIAALMSLLRKFLDAERQRMLDNNIRLNAIGQLERLPADVQSDLSALMQATAGNDGLCLSLALSYGGRSEIVRMAQRLAALAARGQLDPDAITEESVGEHLYTRGIPDPDLMIRTSGEMRISNFLLWQIAYSEICVTETLWPDFDRAVFLGILEQFARRERRFGLLGKESSDKPA
jgi:undecaprenyl diphosphate synthase